MLDETDLPREAARSLERLAPRLEAAFPGPRARWQAFRARLDREFPRLFAELLWLYGARYDFFWHLERILATAAEAWAERPAALGSRDATAEAAALSGRPWFLDHGEVGAVCYADLWAGDLAGLRGRIDYLRGLGITYLHLMPLLRMRAGDNDGGYAVSSYREVEPRIGTMAELEALADDLRAAGIRLCLDMVINHTADGHDWAKAAVAGDGERRGYYRVFPNRTGPDAYEPFLREIFPDRGPEHFTWSPALGAWVWTTFYTFQWDLNFGNPALFRQMAEEMLFLANRGAEVLRLDAVPFIWKEPGTPCENRPGAHRVVRALNAVARLAAPGLAFKSEAIVHPDDVKSYVGPEEAPLSYHPLLMVHLWEALASRDTRLMRHALAKRFALPDGAGWISYVRGHDDIGWGFADEDAAESAIDPHAHRRFLNAFYTGRFPGSFAGGLAFQENPRTGDARISGTTASLCGLDRARRAGDAEGVDLAVRRIVLLHGLILTIGGLPVIYLGDEVATENDHAFEADPARAHDNRWAHRPTADWTAQEAARSDPECPGGRVWRTLAGLIAMRKATPAFGGLEPEILPLDNPHVFGFVRRGHDGTEAPVVVLANMTERDQAVADAGLAAVLGRPPWRDLAGLAGPTRSFGPLGLVLEPYGLACLAARD